METKNILDSEYGENIVINEDSKTYLLESAKWFRFLGIVGFVMVGLIVLIGIFASISLSMISPEMDALGIPSFVVGLYYIVIAIIYFFPCLYMVRFARNMNTGLVNSSQEYVTEGFRTLKVLYRFWGIVTIIALGFVALSFVVGIIFGVAAGSGF
jgi:hypothetical protein